MIRLSIEQIRHYLLIFGVVVVIIVLFTYFAREKVFLTEDKENITIIQEKSIPEVITIKQFPLITKQVSEVDGTVTVNITIKNNVDHPIDDFKVYLTFIAEAGTIQGILASTSDPSKFSAGFNQVNNKLTFSFGLLHGQALEINQSIILTAVYQKSPDALVDKEIRFEPEPFDTADKNFNQINDLVEKDINALIEAGRGSQHINVIVLLRNPVNRSDLDVFKGKGGSITFTYTIISGFAGGIPADRVKAYRDAAKKKLLIIDPDLVLSPELVSSTWQIRATNVWNDPNLPFRGNPNTTIALIDSGIDDFHPELERYQETRTSEAWETLPTDVKIVGWVDIAYKYTTPKDSNGHGTHVANIAAGRGISHAGVARDARLFMARVKKGSEMLEAYDFIKDNARDYHIVVTSMSMGNGSGNSPALERAVKNLTNIGVVTVKSGGNWFHRGITTTDPGRAPTIITVGAVTLTDSVAYFSSNGPNVMDLGGGIRGHKPDVVAPGTLIEAADSNDVPEAFEDEDRDDTHDGGDRCIDNNANSMWDVSFAHFNFDEIVGFGAQHNPIDIFLDLNNNGLRDAGEPYLDLDGNSAFTPGGDRCLDTYPAGAPDNKFSGELWFDFNNNNILDIEGMVPGLDNYVIKSGTSMAAPHVAGEVALIIDAITDYDHIDDDGDESIDEDPWDGIDTDRDGRIDEDFSAWRYLEQDALALKRIVLMNTFEVHSGEVVPPGFPQHGASNAPGDNNNDGVTDVFDRGGKDPKEGYGRIAVDAAIESVTRGFCNYGTASFGTTPWEKKVWSRFVILEKGVRYSFALDNPPTGDYDLFIYNVHFKPPANDVFRPFWEIGEPEILARSINDGNGVDESILDFQLPPNYPSGKYYIVVKWHDGHGKFSLTGNICNVSSMDKFVNKSQIFSPLDYVVKSKVTGLINQSNVTIYVTTYDPARNWVDGLDLENIKVRSVTTRPGPDGFIFDENVWFDPSNYIYLSNYDGRFNLIVDTDSDGRFDRNSEVQDLVDVINSSTGPGFTIRAVMTTDPSGQPKKIFQLNEPVYAIAKGMPPNTQVDFYIVKHQDFLHWRNRGTLDLNSIKVVEKKNVNVNAQGVTDNTKIWDNTRSVDLYNLIVDVNRDGIFTPSIDVVDVINLNELTKAVREGTITAGSSSEAVRELQIFLKLFGQEVQVTGIPDAQTTTALQKYFAEKGLSITSVDQESLKFIGADASVSFKVEDKVEPIVKILSPVKDSIITLNRPKTIRWYPFPLNVSVNEPVVEWRYLLWSTKPFFSCKNGIPIWPNTTIYVNDGDNYLSVCAKDLGGNWGNDTIKFTIKLDESVPQYSDTMVVVDNDPEKKRYKCAVRLVPCRTNPQDYEEITCDPDGDGPAPPITERVYNLRPGQGNFQTSIQAGVDQAPNFGNVWVCSSDVPYAESVMINKPLKLTGSELKGGITINSNQVTLSWDTLSGTGTDIGILIKDSNENDISVSTITGFSTGIKLVNSHRNAINVKSIEKSFQDGIEIDHSSENTVVVSSIAESQRHGLLMDSSNLNSIYIDSVTNTKTDDGITIKRSIGNYIGGGLRSAFVIINSSGDNGISVEDSHQNFIWINSSRNQQSNVKIFNSNNNAFGVSPADNSIEEAGFIIFDSKFNVIWGSASKNKMEGFKFLNVNNSRIDIWQATDNGIDNVVFSDSHDNLINIFNASNSLSGSGVRFRDSDFNEIQIGFANSNKMNGIVLYGSKFNQIAYIQEIKQNTLSGIQLMRSNKNIVYGGSGEDTGISKNEVGISLLESHKNIIGPVNSSANNGAGVQLRRSHNNSIAVLHTFVAPKEFPWVMPSGTQGITSLSPSSHFASNAYGISISHSSGNVIQDSVIAENIVKGIKIENKSPRNIIGSILHIQGINRIIHNRVEVDANETVISDNLLEGSGILIYSTRNLIGPVFTVFGNSISGDIRGIDISGNSNLVFRNRIFENNYGIYLYSGASTILENSIHDNLWGMRIVNSVNTSLIGVRSVSNEDGITLSLTNDSKIERSFICSNSVDIRNESSYGIKGFRNFCDRTENWNDINETLSNVSGCSFVCPTNLPPEVRFLS